MSREQIFLDKNIGLYSTDGSVISLPRVASPQARIAAAESRKKTVVEAPDVDTLLWHSPSDAHEAIVETLKQKQGTFDKELHLTALKVVSLPLFEREFEGNGGTLSQNVAVSEAKFHSSQLIERYVDLVEDETVSQSFLRQCIRDAVVLHLSLRSLHGDHRDDTIILPVGPVDVGKSATSMTILRSTSLGRANLVINDRQKYGVANNGRIDISANELVPGGDTLALANALLNEDNETISAGDQELIHTASRQLSMKIDNYFEYLPRYESHIVYPDSIN
jgi:hypothetical protein